MGNNINICISCDDNYVRYAGNVGGDLETHEYKVTSVMYTGEYPGQIDGVKYLFEYEDNVSWTNGSEYMAGTGYAIMEYKEIDGTTYTFSYIAPVANKNRFAIQDKAGLAGEGYTASLASGSSSGITTPGDKEKYAFDVTGSPKQVTVTFYT